MAYPRYERLGNYIKPEMVKVYVDPDVNHVFMYDQTHDSRNLFLASVDYLANTMDWPPFAAYKGHVFVRDSQFPTDTQHSQQGITGLRKYVRTNKKPTGEVLNICSDPS